MFKAERLSKIKEVLLADNQVSVATLASLLDTTNVTVRSDLEQLEKIGFLSRIHGGAILRNPDAPIIGSASSDMSLPISLADISKEKRAIARMATDYICDNDWIFLDSGSTCCAIAQQLTNKSVKVITNNIVAAYTLSQNPDIDVVVPGGMMDSCGYPFLYGDFLIENLKKMHINKSFISVKAADLKFGYSVSHPQEGNLLGVLKEHSDEVIIVSDSSKFNRSSFMRIGALELADTVIVDDAIPAEYLEYYKEHSVRVFLATP